ncbi:Vitamin B12 import ATP-binding protein BtuD [subsurface metagenome]
MNENALEINGLYKSYCSLFKKETNAVIDFSLQIKKGEIFALLGPNGAGKTSVILTILGLLHKNQGDVKIFGQDCEKIDVKKRISYLPENPSFNFPRYLTAYEYLDLHGSLKGLSETEKLQQINPLLNRLELIEQKDKRISKFSKGMLQRLNIAQAFLGDPDLLFLDEPILGLDPMGIAEIRKLILMFKEKNKTIFINSHLLSEVEKTCDHAGIMINGKLKKILSMEELSDTLYGVAIKISNIEEIKNKIIKIGKIDGKNLVVTVKSEEEIEKVVQKIFKLGGRVTNVSPQIKNLEQFFIELVKKDNEDNN